MKLKKIIFFILFFLFLLTIKANASSADIDISKIADSFNNSIYVSKLANLGEFISAKQDSAGITLSYGNDNIVYLFDNNNILCATYPTSDKSIRKKCDILSAILIDTISTMQGNEPGNLIAFGLDDSFCYTTLNDNGIAKNYFNDMNSNRVIDFKINPFFKLPSLKSDSAIEKNSFLTEYKTLYSDVDCFVKKEDFIFYKTFSENGNMDLYIGQASKLNNLAYDSILTVIDILFDDNRASIYFKQNYSNISNDNFNFNGVSVDTSISELPISNVDTVLLPLNMKYAKFTINRDIVKENLKSIQISESKIGDSTSSSGKISLPIIAFLFVMVILVFCLVIFILKNVINHHK